MVADDVSLDVAEGEALGIVGPNGAGKTSLFNLITDLVGGMRFTVLEEEVVETRTSPMRRTPHSVGGWVSSPWTPTSSRRSPNIPRSWG